MSSSTLISTEGSPTLSVSGVTSATASSSPSSSSSSSTSSSSFFFSDSFNFILPPYRVGGCLGCSRRFYKPATSGLAIPLQRQSVIECTTRREDAAQVSE